MFSNNLWECYLRVLYFPLGHNTIHFSPFTGEWLTSDKHPLRSFSMCWLSWFSGPGCCSCPGFHLRLGASDDSPGLAFCFVGPWTFSWICCPQLPQHPCKTGRPAQVLTAQGGTRRSLIPLHSRFFCFFAARRLILSIHMFTWQLWVNASLIHSIHANTFTLFTRIVATKLSEDHRLHSMLRHSIFLMSLLCTHWVACQGPETAEVPARSLQKASVKQAPSKIIIFTTPTLPAAKLRLKLVHGKTQHPHLHHAYPLFHVLTQRQNLAAHKNCLQTGRPPPWTQKKKKQRTGTNMEQLVEAWGNSRIRKSTYSCSATRPCITTPKRCVSPFASPSPSPPTVSNRGSQKWGFQAWCLARCGKGTCCPQVGLVQAPKPNPNTCLDRRSPRRRAELSPQKEEDKTTKKQQNNKTTRHRGCPQHRPN